MANSNRDSNAMICGICLVEPPINGVQLKCGHIFCYLCIKSASEINCRCASCRDEIGFEFNFQEHELLGKIEVPKSENGKYWFYEGFQGWWLYDPDTNREIEEVHRNYPRTGVKTLEKFIAGGPYIIDIINMTQRRKDEDGARARRICRETLDLQNIVGMAGIKGPDFKQVFDMMRMQGSFSRPQDLPPRNRMS